MVDELEQRAIEESSINNLMLDDLDFLPLFPLRHINEIRNYSPESRLSNYISLASIQFVQAMSYIGFFSIIYNLAK